MEINEKGWVNNMKQLGILLFIVLCGVVLYFSSINPSALTTDTYAYILYIFVGLILLLIFLIPNFFTELTIPNIIIAISLVICMVFTYSYIQLTASSFGIINYMITGIVLLAIIVGLAILFLMIGNYLKYQTGWTGFVTYFIFYIPCLFIDFLKYWTNEIKSTSRIIFYLFIIEIVIIVSYFYLPPLIQSILLKNGIVILDKAMFLNTQHTVSPDISIHVKNPYVNDLTTQNDPIVYRTNYALSMWMYLNVQDSVVSEIPIFDYGNGKPRITYSNKSAEMNKLNIYFTNSDRVASKYQVALPNQKWSQFVFNYSANRADLFINGILTYTSEFSSNNSPTFLPSDRFVIGSENGLNGAICNIKYYGDNLSKSQVANSYNLLVNRNPPL